MWRRPGLRRPGWIRRAAPWLLAAAAALGASAVGGGKPASALPVRPMSPNKELWLPLLPGADTCQTWLSVQNVATEAGQVILVAWGEPGACPPRCAGPLAVECSGLVRPGAAWRFLGGRLPAGSRSGALFKFSARRLSEIAPDLVPPDGGVADYACAALRGRVGQCDGFRRFQKAYREGLEFAGMGLRAASGDGFLAAELLRDCPGNSAGGPAQAAYVGFGTPDLGAFDPVAGGYGYTLPLVLADGSGRGTTLHVQNAGLECAEVAVWFQPEDCGGGRLCDRFPVAPGESVAVAAGRCAAEGGRGSAWIQGSQPLAVVAVSREAAGLSTYPATPLSTAFVGDPESGLVDLFGEDSRVLTAPFAEVARGRRDTAVTVQNTDGDHVAKIRLSAVDPGGHVVATIVDWLCPRGSRGYSVAALAGVPETWVGGVRVESLPWWPPRGPRAQRPPLAAVASLTGTDEATALPTGVATTYRLQPQAQPLWSLGPEPAGHDGTALIALPDLARSPAGPGAGSRVAVTDLARGPGYTRLAVFVYDANGLVGQECRTIGARQTTYLELGRWDFLAPGFRGSALVSAVSWEHAGQPGWRNQDLVHLAATAITDGGRASPGRPLRQGQLQLGYDYQPPGPNPCGPAPR